MRLTASKPLSLAAPSVSSYQYEQVQEMVRLQLGLQTVPKPDDCADALAAAIMAAYMTRRS